MELTESQVAALDHVRNYAQARRADARAALTRLLESASVGADAGSAALSHLRAHARVALHFHPDRQGVDLKTVAHGLLADGVYRNQFETRISNGSVSAHPGGARDLWEAGLYGGAYNRASSSPAQRPKYGALDLLRHPDGPAPRFGSCYLVLRSAVSERCTFSYMDSHLNPDERGTIDVFEDIMAALLAEVRAHGSALGATQLTVPALIQLLSRELAEPYETDAGRPPSRNLDAYIEAQVHADVRLGEDAEVLVADPSFRGTETGSDLERICRAHGIALQWHGGFVMYARETPDDFRGPSMPSLATRVAVDGRVDAHRIGLAVRSLREDPRSWRDRGTAAETLQELKQLWHVLVHCGAPASGA